MKFRFRRSKVNENQLVDWKPLAEYKDPGVEVFSSRDEFKARTGRDPDPFDSGKPPKNWRDLRPLAAGLQDVEYRVLSLNRLGKPNHDPKTDLPYLRTLTMWADEAAAVNLPTGATNAPGEGVPPVPVPLRVLQSCEFLAWRATPVGLEVVVRDQRLALVQPATFTVRDHKLLEGMAAKLGVEL
jgi:hypothetical protein